MELIAGQTIGFEESIGTGRIYRILTREVKNYFRDGGSITVYDVEYTDTDNDDLPTVFVDTVTLFDDALDLVEGEKG